MDLNKHFNRLVPKLFWARHKSEFGEHLATQTSNNIWKKYCYVDDFWQQVAMFNVSNPLFSQVSKLQTDTEKQTSSGNVQNLQLRFGSPLQAPFFDPSPPFFGSWSIIWEPQS